LTLIFKLPLYANKFIEPVPNMPALAFQKAWEDITHNRPKTFAKLDYIMKNPAPPNVPIEQVL